jgi:peptidase M50B-like protein
MRRACEPKLQRLRYAASDYNASMSRTFQALFIVSLLALSWLAMMAVHEFGHVLHAWLSGGSVVRVVLYPLEISRTDVSPNPKPQFVAWGGPLWGALIPLVVAAVAAGLAWRYAYLAKFFAGFCCTANGLYLAAGSLSGAGDAGDLVRHGAQLWQLWVFGVPATLLGFWLWNGLGTYFGLGVPGGIVDRRAALGLSAALVAIVVLEGLFSPR